MITKKAETERTEPATEVPAGPQLKEVKADPPARATHYVKIKEDTTSVKTGDVYPVVSQDRDNVEITVRLEDGKYDKVWLSPGQYERIESTDENADKAKNYIDQYWQQ